MKKGKIDPNEFRQIKIISTGYTRPGAQSSEDEVNALLGEGWELVETYTTCYSNSPPPKFPAGSPLCAGKKRSLSRIPVFNSWKTRLNIYLFHRYNLKLFWPLAEVSEKNPIAADLSFHSQVAKICPSGDKKTRFTFCPNLKKVFQSLVVELQQLITSIISFSYKSI